ncbi:hypothetical protein [Legionella feeleii]|uniref:Putative integrase n=1 Tax=Legionella feeleii TaxID=453 RepID=A0A0W0TH24_9GAMM|nr:hypothetical protein [Legionella feeleii]KTC94884.1 hypothetical protein Lfee_2548 [Legionella feeleii]SPX62032.1 putative integrase [Legionella feeleii]
MSRKQKLTKTMVQYLKQDNQGSLNTRQVRLFAMNRIINDLFVARTAPITWYALTTEHIKKLVNYWHDKGLKAATIMNYLVCLRYFLNKINHTIEGIDNQSLRLVKLRNNKRPEIHSDTVLSAINEPIAYLLFALQAKFGLTLLESMFLVPAIHIHENELWITREISTNRKDRLIPIISEEQQTIISRLVTLTDYKKSLHQQFGEHHLRLAYKFALSTLKLPTQVNYRYLYAKSRFDNLCINHSRQEAKKIVIKETNINKTSPLWSTIHE